MKRSCITAVLALIWVSGLPQNLVRNGDFEEYSLCPDWFAQFERCVPWINPATNIALVSGSPDYYNACAPKWINVPNSYYGYQEARSGAGYCGIGVYVEELSDAREYIEAELSSVLEAGTCYHFEMYVNLAGKYKSVNDSIGAFFSPNLITGVNNYLVLPFKPTINRQIPEPDTVNWQLISGDFVAQGNERCVIIGNFNTDGNSNIRPLNVNGYYTGSYVYIDDVSVTKCGTGTQPEESLEMAHLYPNPFTDRIFIENSDMSARDFNLYDLLSRKVLHQKFTGSATIDAGMLTPGTYLYAIINSAGKIERGTLIKER